MKGHSHQYRLTLPRLILAGLILFGAYAESARRLQGWGWQPRLRSSPACSQRTFYSSAVLVLAGFVTSRLNLAITAREAVKQVLYVPQWEDVFIAYGVIAIGVALFSFAVRHLPIFASQAGQGADSTAQTELAHARL